METGFVVSYLAFVSEIVIFVFSCVLCKFFIKKNYRYIKLIDLSLLIFLALLGFIALLFPMSNIISNLSINTLLDIHPFNLFLLTASWLMPIIFFYIFIE